MIFGREGYLVLKRLRSQKMFSSLGHMVSFLQHCSVKLKNLNLSLLCQAQDSKYCIVQLSGKKLIMAHQIS